MSETKKTVRVRFAPSPTGYLHIGGARTALFNWLYAHHTGGVFLLRIEDTDAERSTEESTRQILESMEWLGMHSDEPVVFQASRYDLHRQYLARLLESGAAYPCYCSKERLESLRESARGEGRTLVYDKRCRTDADWVTEQKKAGVTPVIRFRVPDEGTTTLNDLVYGTISFDNSRIEDFVIARADGSPTYVFSNCIDDVDQGVTHVCRGEDHVSNTPKQILIYLALGLEPPQFAHLPMILGPDKTRLSKRHGATGVMQFRDQGILPGALTNFIALLGWAPEGGGEEVMSLDALIGKFSLDKVNKAPAVFDYEKLLWMNSVYLRAMPREQLIPLVNAELTQRFGPGPFAHNRHLDDQRWLNEIIRLGIERARTITEYPDLLEYFFRRPAHYDEKGMTKHLGTAEQHALLEKLGQELAVMWTREPEITAAGMEEHFRQWSGNHGVKFGAVVHPLRLALTGRTASVGLFDVAYYLGSEETAARIAATSSQA